MLVLQTRRYIVEKRDIQHVADARLGDIELQLFRSIQEINMEKGRREIAKMTDKPMPSANLLPMVKSPREQQQQQTLTRKQYQEESVVDDDSEEMGYLISNNSVKSGK